MNKIFSFMTSLLAVLSVVKAQTTLQQIRTAENLGHQISLEITETATENGTTKFYRWQCPQDGRYDATLTDPGNARLRGWISLSRTYRNQLKSYRTNSSTGFIGIAKQWYLFEISRLAAQQTVTFKIELDPNNTERVSNDHYDAALDLGNRTGLLIESQSGALETEEIGVEQSRWFRWVAPSAGRFVFYGAIHTARLEIFNPVFLTAIEPEKSDSTGLVALLSEGQEILISADFRSFKIDSLGRPPNDTPETALTLSEAQLNSFLDITAIFADAQPNQATRDLGLEGPMIWHRIQLPKEKSVEIRSFGRDRASSQSYLFLSENNTPRSLIGGGSKFSVLFEEGQEYLLATTLSDPANKRPLFFEAEYRFLQANLGGSANLIRDDSPIFSDSTQFIETRDLTLSADDAVVKNGLHGATRSFWKLWVADFSGRALVRSRASIEIFSETEDGELNSTPRVPSPIDADDTAIFECTLGQRYWIWGGVKDSRPPNSLYLHISKHLDLGNFSVSTSYALAGSSGEIVTSLQKTTDTEEILPRRFSSNNEFIAPNNRIQEAFLSWIAPATGAYRFKIDSPEQFSGISFAAYRRETDQSFTPLERPGAHYNSIKIHVDQGDELVFAMKGSNFSFDPSSATPKFIWNSSANDPDDLVADAAPVSEDTLVRNSLFEAGVEFSDYPLATADVAENLFNTNGVPLIRASHHYRWQPSQSGSFVISKKSVGLTTFIPTIALLTEDGELLGKIVARDGNAQFRVRAEENYRIMVYASPDSDANTPEYQNYEFVINKASDEDGSLFDNPIESSQPDFLSQTEDELPSPETGEENLEGLERVSYLERFWTRWTASTEGAYFFSHSEVYTVAAELDNLKFLPQPIFLKEGESILVRSRQRASITTAPELAQGDQKTSAILISENELNTYARTGSPNDFSSNLESKVKDSWFEITLTQPRTLLFNNRILRLERESSGMFASVLPQASSFAPLIVNLEAGHYRFAIDVSASTYRSIFEITGDLEVASFSNPLDLGAIEGNVVSSLPTIRQTDPVLEEHTRPSMWFKWRAPKTGDFNFNGLQAYQAGTTNLLGEIDQEFFTLSEDIEVWLRAFIPDQFFTNNPHQGPIFYGKISSLENLNKRNFTDETPIPSLGNVTFFDIPPPLNRAEVPADQQERADSLTHGGWWTWTAPETALYRISDNNAAAYPYIGETLEALLPLADRENLVLAAGTKIHFWIATTLFFSPQFDVTISKVDEVKVAPNDHFINALPLEVTMTTGTELVNFANFYSNELGEPRAGNSSILPRKTAWWKISPAEDGVYAFALEQESLSLEFFQGTEIESLTRIELPDSVPSAPAEDFKTYGRYVVRAGMTYYLRLLIFDTGDTSSDVLYYRAALPNDEPELALPLNEGDQLTINLANATDNFFNGSDVWYVIEREELEAVILTHSGLLASVSVWEDSETFRGAPLANDREQLRFIAKPGEKYFVQVSGNSATGGLSTLGMRVETLASNSEPDTPFIIPPEVPIVSTVPIGPGTVGPEGSVLSSFNENSTWARYTAPASGNYRFEILGEPLIALRVRTVDQETGWDSKRHFTSHVGWLDQGKTAELIFLLNENLNLDSILNRDVRISLVPDVEGTENNPFDLQKLSETRLGVDLDKNPITASQIAAGLGENNDWGTSWWQWDAPTSNGLVRVFGDAGIPQRLHVYSVRLDGTRTLVSSSNEMGQTSASFERSFGLNYLIAYSAPRLQNRTPEVYFGSHSARIHGEISKLRLDGDQQAIRDLATPLTSNRETGFARGLIILEDLKQQEQFGEFLRDFLSLTQISKRLQISEFFLAPTSSLGVGALTPAEFSALVDQRYREDLELAADQFSYSASRSFEDLIAGSELGATIEADGLDGLGVYLLVNGILSLADFCASMESQITMSQLLTPDWDSASILSWLGQGQPEIIWKERSGEMDQRFILPLAFQKRFFVFSQVQEDYENDRISKDRSKHLVNIDLDQFVELSRLFEFFGNQAPGQAALLRNFLALEGTVSSWSPQMVDSKGKIQPYSLPDPSLGGLFPGKSNQEWHQELRLNDRLAGPGNFTAWAAERGIAASAKDSDPDQDGRTNWNEYAFGSNPFESDPYLIPISIRTNPIQIKIIQRVAPLDISYSFEQLLGETWIPISRNEITEVAGSTNPQLETHSLEPQMTRGIYRLRAIDQGE